MKLRGIDDFDKVQIDPWPAGSFDSPHEDGRRISRCISYYRDEASDNGYAQPIEGVVVFFDMGAGKVLEVVDHGVVPMPEERRPLPARRGRTDARRPEAARDRPARRPELRGRRAPRALVALVVPRRLRSVRGAGAPHGRVPRRRPRPPGAAPGVDHRDGRALRRPRADARVEERVRRRRVGPRPHGQLAEARLRLPRRHPLLRRRARHRAGRARTRSSTPSACTKRTTASSGSTTTCRAAPTRPAGRAAWW